MTPAQARFLFIRLMKEFPFGHDTAHILVAMKEVKKEKVVLSTNMYSALISRLALSLDCNPETIIDLVKEAEESKHTLTINTYNNLMRYFATIRDLAQCQRIAELVREKYRSSEKLSTTLCLLTQAACIVRDPDLAWKYYCDLKKISPNCLKTFKNLYRHILAVLIKEVHKHLDQISTLLSDLRQTGVDLQQSEFTNLKDLLQKRPGYPFYCVSIVNYAREHKIKPNLQFENFVKYEMYSLKHSDMIRYYIEAPYNNPDAPVQDMLGPILFFVHAKEQDQQMVEYMLNNLYPVASTDATSSPAAHYNTRDAYVYAIAIDMYTKLGNPDAVMHTYEFMTNEGASPNFLINALLFCNFYYCNQPEKYKDYFEKIKPHLAEHTQDFLWLCAPVLKYYCDVVSRADAEGHAKIPELEELRSLIPRSVAYLGFDDRNSFAEAVKNLAEVRAHLAVALLSAMKQYDPAQISAEAFQPLIDVVCNPDTKKGKKSRKKDEIDILKLMKETEITPTPAQAQTLVRWYQSANKYKQVDEILREWVASAPDTPGLAQVITDFLVGCAEHKEGILVEGLLERTQGKVHFTQAQLAQVASSLFANKLGKVGLAVMRWVHTHARAAFGPVRADVLKDAPQDAPWVKSLREMS